MKTKVMIAWSKFMNCTSLIWVCIVWWNLMDVVNNFVASPALLVSTWSSCLHHYHSPFQSTFNRELQQKMIKCQLLFLLEAWKKMQHLLTCCISPVQLWLIIARRANCGQSSLPPAKIIRSVLWNHQTLWFWNVRRKENEEDEDDRMQMFNFCWTMKSCQQNVLCCSILLMWGFMGFGHGQITFTLLLPPAHWHCTWCEVTESVSKRTIHSTWASV